MFQAGLYPAGATDLHPHLPGCVSEGETLAEILANVREAAEGWLEVSAERAAADPQAQVVEIEL